MDTNFNNIVLQRENKFKQRGNIISNYPLLFVISKLKKNFSDIRINAQDITLTEYPSKENLYEWVINTDRHLGIDSKILDDLEDYCTLFSEISPEVYLRILPLYQDYKSLRIIYKDSYLCSIDDDLLIYNGFNYLTENPLVLYPAFNRLFQLPVHSKLCLDKDLYSGKTTLMNLNNEYLEDFISISLYDAGDESTFFLEISPCYLYSKTEDSQWEEKYAELYSQIKSKYDNLYLTENVQLRIK